MPTIDQRVQSGIQVLDSSTPGWRELVDVEELDMSSTRAEIRGQIARKPVLMDYQPQLIRSAIDNGFMPENDETFEELTDAWKRALASE